MARQTIAVSILAEASGVRKGVDQANGHLGRMEGRANKLGRILKTAFVGGAAVAAFSGIIGGASDAQQSIGATEQIYGKYAKTVIARSNAAAKSVGLSANEYRELSNVSGAMLKSSGLPLAKVTTLTDKLNRRAADLAATFGGTTKDAVGAVGSLLRGEADPIERYGVSIKQSDVNARLAAKGLDGLTGSARKQAEQQERLKLLFAQTKDASGQFGRETNTLAGQQQRLGAQFANIKAEVGAKLLPTLTRLLAVAGEQLPGAFATVKTQAQGFADAVAPVAAALRDAFITALPALQSVGAFLLDHKGLVVGLVAAYATFRTVNAALKIYRATMLSIKAVQQAYALGTYGMATANGGLVTSLAASAGALRVKTAAALTSVGATGKAVAMDLRWQVMLAKQRAQIIATAVAQRTVALATSAWSAAQWLLNAAMTANPIGLVIVGLVALGAGLVLAYQKSETFRTIVNAGFALVRAGASALYSAVRSTLGKVGSVLTVGGRVVRLYVNAHVAAFRAVVGGARALYSGVRSAISKVGSVISGIKGKVTGALSSAGSWLKGAGGDIVNGLINGIKAAIPRAVNAAKDLAGKAVSAVKNKLKIWSPSRVFTQLGKYTGEGFALGMTSTSGLVKGASLALGDTAINTLTRSSKAARLTRRVPLEVREALIRPTLDNAAVVAGAGSSGPRTYYITVEVKDTMSPAEIGRKMSKAIKEYERTQGAGR